jgi:cystathionine gamma-synthase
MTASGHPEHAADAGSFETQAIHAGQPSDPRTGAAVPPIYQVSTYQQDAVGSPRDGWEYSRSANPTRSALEECLAALEKGSRGLAFASGLAAEDCLLRTVCAPGDHVIVPDDAYGGTYRLVARVFDRWGVSHTSVSLANPDAVAAAIRPETRLIWCETPTNPLMGIADIGAIAAIAQRAGVLLAVDNTFASPYLQQPLVLGADVVVHSTTKYLGGHSDVVGGALVASDPELAERLAFHQNAMGAIAGPFDSWLVMRGIKTLPVRMDRHCANAGAVADFLAARDDISVVRYPGLASHAGHDVAAKQMRGFGGMLSFQLVAGAHAAIQVCNRARIFTLAESLGGVESLIEHPATMTHASVAGSSLEVPADLVRLSVGLESVDDLIADLGQALGAAR